MARRSYQQLMIDVLLEQPKRQASKERLAVLLGWPLERVQKIAAELDENDGVPVQIGRGGTVQHRGRDSEELYADIGRIISDYWGPRQLGLKNISPIRTARSGTRGEGVWSHPDIVIAADPRRRRSQDEPRRLHAVEVETKAGFDLRSVYQAHAQGKGADYTWVIGNKSPGVDLKDWRRVFDTAQELGVGLVTYSTSGAYGSWIHHLDAVEKQPSADERESFIVRALGPVLRASNNL